MLNIGIVTLFYKNYNYGGLLQAFAMQRIFSSNNSEAKLIKFKTNRLIYICRRLSYLGVFQFLKNLIKKMYFNFIKIDNDFYRDICLRKQRFDKFMSCIPQTELYTEKNITLCDQYFDKYICGSDQVWNPGWWNSILFLSFSKKSKYSYAASIARDSLSQREIDYMVSNLESFNYVSVREIQAQKLLESKCNKKIEFVLDPTFLVDYSIWEQLAVTPNVNEDYVLFYMVGDSKGLKESVYNLCKRKGLKVFSIGFSKNTYYKSDLLYSDFVIRDAGPREWIGWIKNSKYIFTDSFHGCVFSTIFKKQFWCFERDNPTSKSNENSRLYNLLNITGLTSRLLNYESKILFEDFEDINYEKVWDSLSPFIKYSKCYVDKCIKD